MNTLNSKHIILQQEIEELTEKCDILHIENMTEQILFKQQLLGYSYKIEELEKTRLVMKECCYDLEKKVNKSAKEVGSLEKTIDLNISALKASTMLKDGQIEGVKETLEILLVERSVMETLCNIELSDLTRKCLELGLFEKELIDTNEMIKKKSSEQINCLRNSKSKLLTEFANLQDEYEGSQPESCQMREDLACKMKNLP